MGELEADSDDDTAEFPLPEEYDADGLPTDYLQPARPPKQGFAPWHRARKQYVREKQWTGAVKAVLARRDPSEPLKYIGLPGLDLLDLRHLLKTVCEPMQRKLHFVGFDVAAGSQSVQATELNISEAELRSSPLVIPLSGVRPDDLRIIKSRETGAWQALRALGYADVINIDLTGSLFANDPTADLNYQAAVRSLLELQWRNPNPWVMLLTTTIDRATADSSALAPMDQVLDAAKEKCPDLAEFLDAELSSEGLEVCDGAVFGKRLLISAAAWMRGVVSSRAPRPRLKVASCFVYSNVSGTSEDMASLVIRFDPNPVALADDAHGVEVNDPEDTSCVDLLGYAKRIVEMKNIDNLLAQDPQLKGELVESAADLMEEARFSRADYVAWALGDAS